MALPTTILLAQGGLKAASVNRRLEAVRCLLRWAEASGIVARNVALHVKSIRTPRDRRPHGLTPPKCIVCCVPQGKAPTGWLDGITPWFSSCSRPDCESVK